MNKIPLEIGRMARSVAGRDAGKLLVVIAEVDSDFVLTADGDLRKIDRPKKKRRKHLSALPDLMPREPWPPQDHQIRAWLKAAQQQEEE